MPNRDSLWGDDLYYNITAGLGRYLNRIRLLEIKLGSMGEFERKMNRQIIDVAEQKNDA